MQATSAAPDHRAIRAYEQHARRAADAARAPGADAHRDRPRARAPASACSTRSRRPVRRRSCWCWRPRPRQPRRRSTVTELAMRACGGAAFGGAHGLERHVPRRPRADRHGADDRPGLRLHRPRALRHGGVLMTAGRRQGRRGHVRPQGLGDLGDHPRLLRRAAAARSTCRSTAPTSCRSTRCSSGTIDIAWNSPLAWLDAQRRAGGACRAIAMRDTDRDRVVAHRRPQGRPGPRDRRPARARRSPLGAADSPQATLIPLGRLRQAGLEPRPRRPGPAVRRAGRQARRPRRRRARGVRVPGARRGATPARCSI